MAQQMQLWEDLYLNRAGWIKKCVKSRKIPANIVRELKRLTLTEFTATIHNAPELQAAFLRTIQSLRRKMDFGLAIGGLLLKPYFTAQGVAVDIVPQDAYLPVNYTDDTCDAIVCPQEIAIGKTYYTRLEYHVYDRTRQIHTIQNRCFRSSMPGILGTECRLSDVQIWADILPVKTFEQVQRPLFAIFQAPDSNNIDPASPLGVSVFADAIEFIRDADEQWERILWELESSERAIDATEDLFRYKDGKPDFPKGRERMFRSYEATDGKSFINTFSPEVRDTSYFNAFNQMLRRIENAVGLSYGTLSEVSDVEKTAEEVRSSKQRSFSRVKDIQENLRTALDDLLYGMQYYRDYYANQTNSPVKATFSFGDGVLEDPDVEYQRRSQMVRDKILKPELFLSWYFDCSEDKAKGMMPEQQDDGGLFSGGEI
ncbi:hypothetical protein [Ruminococcus sp.]|uniref:hypothetical protein n=1 Tax=Ruminococcus sp. TaxID=41978 RepID=UPI0025F26D14|nr:hypothetical protein [Ruminococcus sp.]